MEQVSILLYLHWVLRTEIFETLELATKTSYCDSKNLISVNISVNREVFVGFTASEPRWHDELVYRAEFYPPLHELCFMNAKKE